MAVGSNIDHGAPEPYVSPCTNTKEHMTLVRVSSTCLAIILTHCLSKESFGVHPPRWAERPKANLVSTGPSGRTLLVADYLVQTMKERRA